ncbi:hypothetical protein B0T20DRAFT_385962 [Sordaria brevicollis]|uniref:Uncharacterized protein n=1 Tax=Sordaria brevicollis TaxID=83679 RepID=A0AAE0NWX6_SORBR|nr:hypothetical protein B0T20DRAFT_385962 [Sordaria brevicollis]
MCLEKRKLYTVCGHISSGVRVCQKQRDLNDAIEAAVDFSRPGNGASTSKKLFCCPRLSKIINPRTACERPYPYFTETRLGFCGRCQAYYRSTCSAIFPALFPPRTTAGEEEYKNVHGWNEPVDAETVPGKIIFAGIASPGMNEEEVREDPKMMRCEIAMLGRLVPFTGEDVGGAIMKLENLRLKTLVWGEEGRKSREWKEGLGEREMVWEREGDDEEEEWEDVDEEDEDEEETDEQTETDSQKTVTTTATATDSDEADEVVNRALISSYHDVLARLAYDTTEIPSVIPTTSEIQRERERLLSLVEERRNNGHVHPLRANPVTELDYSTNLRELGQPEDRPSSTEDIYYECHGLSDIPEERSSEYTKSQPSRELTSQPSMGSLAETVKQSPTKKEKTACSPVAQPTSITKDQTHSVRLTKSNLARFCGPEALEEDKAPAASTKPTLTNPGVAGEIRPLNRLSPFALAATLTTSDELVKSGSALRDCAQDASPVASSAQKQPLPVDPPKDATASDVMAANVTTRSIQSWENFTISTPSQSLRSSIQSFRTQRYSMPFVPPAPRSEIGIGERDTSTQETLRQFGLTTTSLDQDQSLSPNNSGQTTPRVRRREGFSSSSFQSLVGTRLQALNEDIYLRPKQPIAGGSSGASGSRASSGLGASVFGEMAKGVAEREDNKKLDEGKGRE